MEVTKTQQAIADMCDRIKAMLLEKNMKYGDSAIHPKRLFSRSSATEQILVRLDDKISRLAFERAGGKEDEDVIRDMAGYLILYMVAREEEEEHTL